MFIGNRFSVIAGPTGRGAGSRDASEAITLTPLAASAEPRLGLSLGTCGSDLSPECSPVTSSLAVMAIPLLRAQSTFCLIWALMSACDTHLVLPSALVAHCHGTTVKSCTQPRYRCEYVWLSQRRLLLLASRLAVSGSFLAPASTLPSALKARSSFIPYRCCHCTSVVTSAGFMRMSVPAIDGSQPSPIVQSLSVFQRASGRNTSSTWTLNQFRQCPRWTPLVSHCTRPWPSTIACVWLRFIAIVTTRSSRPSCAYTPISEPLVPPAAPVTSGVKPVPGVPR